MNRDTMIQVGVLLALALAGYLVVRKLGVQGIASGAVGAAANAASGTVLGVGDVLGIPRTDAEKCAAAKREGRTFDASKYCTAGNFIGYLFGADEPAVEPRPATVAYDYGYGAGSGPLRPGLAAPASDSYFQYWGT